eukprot:gene11677-24457_t
MLLFCKLNFLFISLSIEGCAGYSAILPVPRLQRPLSASTALNAVATSIAVSPNQKVNSFELPKAKYLSATPSSRWQMGRKLTPANKKYSDMGLKLRAKYLSLRLLTEEEEKLTGKFSFLGKRLEIIKKSLKEKLGREPTDAEWAQSCRLTDKNLNAYLLLSQKARNRLVEHNMRLADFWVRRFLENTKAARDVSYYELMTEAIIGLTKAAEHYDGRSRFGYYSQFYIRAAIYKGLTELKPGSYSSMKNIMINIKAMKIQQLLFNELKRKPTDAEIASKLKMKVTTYLSIKSAAGKKVTSAESFVSQNKGGDDNLQTYLDLYLTSKQENTYSMETRLWQIDFNHALNCLTPLEKRTIAIRYGLMDGTPRSIDTTAELMCVTPEGIRQIIVRAMDKLRCSPASSVLEDGPPQQTLTTTSGRLGGTMY